MAVQILGLSSFNRGRISRFGLARTDIERVNLSAEVMTNWMPRVLGSMMLRPGWKYLGATLANAAARFLAFIFSTDDTALVELTNLAMRIWIDDVLLTRAAVSSAVTNGDFSTQYSTTATISNASPGVVTYVGADNFANNDKVSFTTTGALPAPLVVGTFYYVKNLNAGANTFEVSSTVGGASINTTSAGSGAHTAYAYYFISGWTDNDESGATSTYVDGGYLGLTGNGTNSAIRDQQVTVAVGDRNVEHALRVVINRGPVVMSVGSTSGGGEYYNKISIESGTQSLAFTPTGNFYIRFQSSLKRQVLVDSCNVESAGVVSIPTTWPTSALDKVRQDQSGDVLFVAAEGYQQQRIERRSARSWGVARYAPENGPLMVENTGPVTLTPSALSGNITVTASKSLFVSTQVGGLYRITSTGQDVTASVTAENQFTSAIRITGTGTQRAFTVIRSNTGTGTATLQQSLTSDSGPWVDKTSGTGAGTGSFNDGLDNQIAWYRYGVKTGDFIAGTIDLELRYSLGAVDGIVRITGYTSPTAVSAEVLVDLGGITATDIWAEGSWSDYRGWPSSVSFHEGRLWWAGKNGVWGSISDNYTSFDENATGDSAPLNRVIGSGPVDTINFILSLQRLILGAEGAELSCKSNNFDEPLTPTNFNIKTISTQGSASVGAVRVDTTGIYVQRGGTRVFELLFAGDKLDYDSVDLTAFIPEIGRPSIVRMAVQRQPDTRIHCIRSDGTAGVVVFDQVESVICWLDIETRDGDEIEDVVILPGPNGEPEDQVYYDVSRSVNGSTARYLEKWAQESECRGGTLNKQADAFVEVSPSGTGVSGLDHLEGEDVIAWGDGIDLGTYTVSSGAITLNQSTTSAIVGLPYTARWKSAKLAQGALRGTALTQRKRLDHVGVILADTHYQGLRYGRDFDNLDELPLVEDGKTAAANTIHESFDKDFFEFPGEWNTDSRVCLEASAPRPCTLLALVMPIDTREKA